MCKVSFVLPRLQIRENSSKPAALFGLIADKAEPNLFKVKFYDNEGFGLRDFLIDFFVLEKEITKN
jgi:hypothetical protein